MHLSFTEKKNIRKNFGKLKETLSIPNLIEVQKNSYNSRLKKYYVVYIQYNVYSNQLIITSQVENLRFNRF